MGRDKAPPKRPSPAAGHGVVKTVARVQFRVTPAQRAELEQEAEKRGLSVYEVARQRCFLETGSKRVPRALAPVTSGFVRGVLAVVFRVTQAQLDLLELEAIRWGTTAGEVARRRCFPTRAKQAA